MSPAPSPRLLEVPTAGGALPVTAFEADGERAVLIFPAIFGVDAGTQELAAWLAARGVTAWVGDFAWRTVPGVIPPARFREALDRYLTLDVSGARADVAAAAEALRARHASVTALGVCFGGRFALFAAAEGVVDAAVTFHGGRLGQHLDLADAVRCPLSLHFGQEDGSIPMDEVEAVRAAFGDKAAVHVHPGVGHGFTIPGHPGWSAGAAALAWEDLLRVAATAG